MSGELPNTFHVQKTHNCAVIPTRAHPTDAGWDITVTEGEPTDNPQVTLYNTNLIVSPPRGYYLELYARSSLWKKGYMLANTCGGVIDPEYRGEIKMALFKFNPNAPDLKLPQRVGQLIPRKIHDVEFQPVRTIDIETQRGAGGFGSTGN